MSEIRFRDLAGWQWEVVESSKRRVSDHKEGDRRRALYFLNRYQTRRIEEFPTDWARRPPKDLIRLCEVAEPI